MNTNATTAQKLDTKVLLSTLWLLVYLNILMADVLTLNVPGSEKFLEATSISTGAPIPILMLMGAVLNNLSLIMIFLSRALKYGVNRWVNIVMSIVTVAYIWGFSSPYPHYMFIATVETVCLLFIIWISWKWTEQGA